MNKFNNLVKIIYASTSGNVEIVCEKIADVLGGMDFAVQLMRAEKTKIQEINDHNLFILATSTWEHGAINPFYEELLAGIKDSDMTGKNAGIVGLGDTRYEPRLFCEGAEILKRTFTENGGNLVHVPLKLNGDPYKYLGNAVVDWSKYFVKSLNHA